VTRNPAPPAGIEAAGTTHPPASDLIFDYPKYGQSSEQQSKSSARQQLQHIHTADAADRS
jgi:hypothetical protein